MAAVVGDGVGAAAAGAAAARRGQRRPKRSREGAARAVAQTSVKGRSRDGRRLVVEATLRTTLRFELEKVFSRPVRTKERGEGALA